MVRTHQPGQDAFRSILPEDIDWKTFPTFPPSVRLENCVGRGRTTWPKTEAFAMIKGASGDYIVRNPLTHLDGLQARLVDMMEAWEGDEA